MIVQRSFNSWKKPATRGSAVASTIASYKRGMDGHGAFFAIVTQHAGVDKWEVTEGIFYTFSFLCDPYESLRHECPSTITSITNDSLAKSYPILPVLAR